MSEELAGKQLALDFREDEAARGITIDSASVSMVHDFKDTEYLINLIDTPGHVDFGGDVTRAMRAVDGAIVLSCASEGIMPQTETVLRQALKERVKPILFINKVDRLIKELKLTPEAMQERFINIITSVNKLIKDIAEEEYGEKWSKISPTEGNVAFGSAFHNWALSIPYMQEKGISFKEIIDAYNSGDDAAIKDLAKKAPLHEVVLNMVIEHLPDPVEAQKYRIPKIWKGDIETELGQGLMKCDPNGKLAFVITKIVIDPQAGEISAGRLFSGTMSKGTEVYLNKMKQKSKIQQVFIYNGAKREIVDHVPAGNIIGIAGVKSYPGETITVEQDTPFEEITHIFEPVITKAVEATKPADLPKLIDVLRQVGKEDPSIKIEINEETGEHLMHGMGELHLEIIENRIKENKGVDIKTREVPDWVNYSLIFSGIGLRLLYSVITFDWMFLVEGVAGLAAFVILGYIMFYAGQWGGGDSKMMMGLGALIGLRFSLSPVPLLLVFLFNILLVGSVYGLIYSMVLAVRTRKSFVKNFRKVITEKKMVKIRRVKIFIVLGLLLLLLIAMNKGALDRATGIILALFVLLLYISFYLVVFVKAVELSSMYKMVDPEDITEGDWIAEDVVIKGKRITGPKDLGIEKKQIKKLIALKKEGEIDKVKVKYGIPFVPSFLIAFILSLSFGAWWVFLF